MRKFIISWLFLGVSAHAGFYVKGGAGVISTKADSIIKLDKENTDRYLFLNNDNKGFSQHDLKYLTGGVGYQYDFQNVPFFVGSEVLFNYKNQTLTNSFNDDGIVNDEGVERVTSVRGNTSLKLGGGVGLYVLSGYKITNDFSLYLKKGLSLTQGIRDHKGKVSLDGLDEMTTNSRRSHIFKNLEIGGGIEYKINEKFSIGGEVMKSFALGRNKAAYTYGTLNIKYNF